jgi:hypothetical protein
MKTLHIIKLKLFFILIILFIKQDYNLYLQYL